MSDAARAGRNTIGDLLTRSAERYRDRIALRWGGTAWSYRALNEAAERAATALLASGLHHGDRVVAYGRNSDLYLLAWLACCKAGLVHVSANYALTAQELRYIVQQSGASLILHDPALSENALASGIAARLFAEAVAGEAVRDRRRPSDRYRHRAALLHLRHHGIAQRRRDDPPRPDERVCEFASSSVNIVPPTACWPPCRSTTPRSSTASPCRS